MTPVEKVARAIYESHWHDVEGFQGDPYYGSCATLWENWIPAARAAIQALMEPSKGMVGAPLKKMPEHANWLNARASFLVWQAMLTAALEEE